MKRCGLALILMFALVATSHSALAALPTGGDVVGGHADMAAPTSELLIVDQKSNRAVIRWDTFNIGDGAEVRFVQPGDAAAVLNIVNGTTASTLAGKLTADGSVFLINPYGITITEHGVIDTRGAFVAATLQAVDVSKFMDGDGLLEFQAEEDGPEGRVTNEGVISARDVVLLGSRVANTGTMTAGDAMTARIGRVALGSASYATLDLSGDGFLQVLAPADVTGDAALVTNSGDITADGGLVQLQAATVYEAMREAVHMDGTVRARSVEGRDGAIVFSGGKGGTVTVSGTVDASPDPDQGGIGGGSIHIDGTVVDLDFDGVHLGAGGHFSLAADDIQIVEPGSGGWSTVIVESLDDGSIGNLLRAGVNVTLHGNDSITWQTGLIITEDQLADGAAGKSGNLHLKAGRTIALGGGTYSTWNGDWTLTVNAKPVSGIQLGDASAYIQMFTGSGNPGDWARFTNHGHLKIEILDGKDSAGLRAGGIDLPIAFSGRALTAYIAPGAIGYDEVDITIRGDVDVVDAITLSGNLRTIRQNGSGVTTLNGGSVTWATETTDRLAGGLLRFVEDGMITRFGRGGAGPTGPGVDATRLILGSKIPVFRLYGDPDPDAQDLWEYLFHLAPHNKLKPGQGITVDEYTLEPVLEGGIPLEGIPASGIPLTDILLPGSIIVEGPGRRGETNQAAGIEYYYLRVAATDQIAFRPLEVEHRIVDGEEVPWYLGGAAGSYWIDFSEVNEMASRIPLVIEPRPISVEFLNPSYTYGDLHQPLLRLDGVVNNDEIIPTGRLTLVTGGDGDETTLTYVKLGEGFGFNSRLNRGQYAYTVDGLTGDRAGNYVLNRADLGEGTLHITPRQLSYRVFQTSRTYGDSVQLPDATLTNVLGDDDVRPILEIFRGDDRVENSVRLGAGSYAVKVTALAGDDAGNYVVGPGEDGLLRVERRLVSWFIDDAFSEYGTMAEFDITLNGVLEGDDVVARVALRDVDLPLTARTRVGVYSVIANALVGADSGNYSLLSDWSDMRNRVGTLTINPKLLSLDMNPVTIRYGDTSGGRLLGEVPLPKLVGVLGGDEVSLKRGSVQTVKVGDGHGPTSADIGVGEYELSVVVDGDGQAVLEGFDSANYALPDGVFSLRMTVTPRLLDVTAWDTNAVYGTRAHPGYSIDGVLGGDQVFGEVTVWQGAHRVDYAERTPRGLYTLRVTDLWGDEAANYTINPLTAVAGTLAISPKVLGFGSPVALVYGDELRIDAGIEHGVLAGDSVQVTAFAQLSDGTIVLKPGVGTYTGVATELSGADAANYVLPDEAARTFGGLTITKRPLTIRVLDQTRTYGEHAQAVSIFVDNLVPGDTRPSNITFGVSREAGGTFTPLTERTNVGTYRLRAIGLDDPNYTLASAGHTDGLLQILPRQIRYITFDQQLEYGVASPVFNGFQYAELLKEDILPGDQVYAGDVVVADRDMYPERLPVQAYRLALDSLDGIHSGNYVLTHAGSTQGMLTITPRLISAQLELLYNGNVLRSNTWNFGDLEMKYGFHGIDDDGFTVHVIFAGVLENDDVSLSILAPKLERSSQRYLTVGEYVWSVAGLAGVDGGNYVLQGDDLMRQLSVRPRPVRLTIGPGALMYGDPIIDLGLGFAGEDDGFFAGNHSLDVSNVVIRSSDGVEYSVDQLMGESIRLPAMYYILAKADEGAPVLSGADARNFDVTLSGGFHVDPRPLVFERPSEPWIYGDRFFQWRLYSDILGPDGRLGIFEDDDVSVDYSTPGIGVSENNKGVRLDPDSLYNPAGTYSGIGFRLTGDDARNYTIVDQPGYTVTILPRPLRLPTEADGFPVSVTYGDELRPAAGQYGGILPEDGDLFVGIADQDGTLRPVHVVDAGRYGINRLGLVGRWAGNYVLETDSASPYLTIAPRDVRYNIEDVLGQYGNFLGCLDPAACNGGPTGRYGSNYLWVPGLALGEVRLEGVRPGDEVRSGEIVLVDANGRTGKLADVPPPGVYFQVLEGLTGKDAHNYRLAEQGSRPGILTIHPQWVRWQTHHGLYMPETGPVTLVDNNAEEFERGFVPTLRTGMKDHKLEPTFNFIRLNAFFEEEKVVDGSKLTPGNYVIAVAGFGGPDGADYQPVPRELSDGEGIVTVFRDSTLGLDFVGGVRDPFGLGSDDVADESDIAVGGSGPSFGGDPDAFTPVSALPSSDADSTDAGSELGGRFGRDIDYSLFENGNGRASAYAEALAEYGVTGVTLIARGGVSVEFRVGEGYVQVGTEAGARASAGLGPTGVRAGAEAGAGVSAGGGIEGSLGGGVDGSASGTIELGARARVRTGVGLQDGRLQVGSEAQVGAGPSVRGGVGVSGDGYAIGAGTTVYGPGTLAKDISVSAGFSDGVFSLSGRFGLAIGIAGLGFDFDLAIDFNKLLDAVESAGCTIGLWDCPVDILALGRDISNQAASIAYDPAARFDYLVNNPEWTVIGEALQLGQNVPEEARRAYEENVEFFNSYVDMLDTAAEYVRIQQDEQEAFFRQLQNNPYDALMMAQSIAQEQEMYGGLYQSQQIAESLYQKMNALGVRMAVVDGEIQMVGR